METIDLLVTGGGLGILHSLLLLLLKPEDLLTDEYVEEKVAEYVKDYKNLKYNKDIKNFVRLVFNDKFSYETLFRPENQPLIVRLDKLRQEILDFYFSTIEELFGKGSGYERVCEIDLKLGSFILQLLRLRMVIQPQYGLSVGKHPKTDIEYMSVKSYWRNDDNTVTRKFTKSMGLASNYPEGIKDPKANEDGLKLVQEVMLNEYLQTYPE